MKREMKERKNCCCGGPDEHCCEQTEEKDCCCDNDCDCDDDCSCDDSYCTYGDECNNGHDVSIKILGGGCSKCKKLEKNAQKAVDNLGIKAKIIKVTDMKDIMSYGVMSTPALVIDEKVVSSGQVPNAKQIAKLLDQ